MSDLTKLAIFALQYACALIGALIAVQLLVFASGDKISPSDQTSTASERRETWGPTPRCRLSAVAASETRTVLNLLPSGWRVGMAGD